MSTTNLFVELIVIGVGAFLWVVLLLVSILGYDKTATELALTPGGLIFMLSVIYVLGIITDRLADGLFDILWGRKIRERNIGSLANYYDARRRMSENSRHLADLLEYGRSRLRICRGWAFNSALTVLALNVFLIVAGETVANRTRTDLVGTIGLVLLTVGAWYSWKRIAESEYRRVKEYMEQKGP